MKLLLIILMLSMGMSQFAYADMQMRADKHAPIGVMGDHGHNKGELMLSYRYGRMEMDGNRSGSSDIGTSEVLKAFSVSPLEMTMEMHIFGAMYGLGNNLTLMAMVPYVDKSMDLINRDNRKIKTNASGLGDIKISVIHKFHSEKSEEMPHHDLSVKFGLSLPSGDINKKNPSGMPLPYPMQLGSGTYDPMIGVTYVRFYPQWSWGLQFNTTQRLGKNNKGYRLGDEYQATTWAAYRHSDYLSASLRINGKSWNNISGRDKRLDRAVTTALVPTARTDLRAGERAELGIGINFMQPRGMFKDHRLAAEVSVPFYQHLDGPQLEVDYMYTLGWQAVF